jgi:hypothetical protein
MATKSSTKTTKTKTSKKTTQKHDLLYIMSNSCGWCKKADPVVEELIKDGHKITKLDVMNPDEATKANDAKAKHNAQCGTPLFLDAETGNSVCGFREKDVLEKWAKGEEIPAPPRPKGPPPPPPQNFDDEGQVNAWKEKYGQWCKDNDHMPKLLPADDVLNRMKIAQQQRAAQQAQQGGAQGAPVGLPGAPNAVPQQAGSIVVNTQFYYAVVNGQKSAVMADNQFINGLAQQYFVREPNGQLTKVVGDISFNSNTLGANAGTIPPQAPPTPAAKPAPSANKEANEKVAQARKQQMVKKAEVAKKSKENKKTIESF